MAEQKLRVGIVGVGMFAIYFHAPQLRATGRAETTAIYRRSPERLAIARDALQVDAVYTDWRTMLYTGALDAVVVSTPHHYHSVAEARIVTIKPGPQY